MERRMKQWRAPGQSLPLIALMIVVLVAMVGLSVDVGNTFNEERRAVAAANAASLAAMNQVIRAGDLDTNQVVYDSIIRSLRSNGIDVAPHGQTPTGNQLVLRAFYLDPQGRLLDGMPEILPIAVDIPNNVGFIQVTLSGDVDTYFARVVGRNDLPIGATAYAGQCSMGQGVYPIMVAQQNIDGEQMRKPNPPDANNDGIIDDGWRVINSGPHAGKTARWLYNTESDAPGSFGFARWMDSVPGASSNVALANSVKGEGNLSAGFEEAPYPSSNPPSDYPSRPGELNEGDWVHGTTGLNPSNDVSGALNAHIEAGTIMTLPIYDRVSSQGNNTVFRVVGFGRFVMLGWHTQGQHSYFDMVYLGPATQSTVACQFSAVPIPDDDCCELWGDISFWPEYQIVPHESQPIQYIVVLDVSGSMSANFDGQCDNNNPPLRNPQLVDQPSRFRQCTNGPMYVSAVDGSQVPGHTEVTGTGPNWFWLEPTERRIFVAKHAIESMIRELYMPGNARFDNNPNLYPPDQFGLVVFHHESNPHDALTFANGSRFTSDPADAIQRVIGYRNGINDDYRVQGGTNAAAGLYRAWLTFQSAPDRVYHEASGRYYDYKRVVIFVTDGVSNQFLNKNHSTLRLEQSTRDTFTSNSRVFDENGQQIAGFDWERCRDLGGLVIEDGICQTTLGGGLHNGRDRPITEAIQVSNEYLKANGVEVFALALSTLPETGLASGIPSSPQHYRSAANLERNADGSTNVDGIMRTFQSIVEDGRCRRGLDPAPISSFEAASFRPISLMTGGTLSFPNVGQVTVHNSVTGQSFTTFIRIDQDGQLRYRFAERIPPGLYTLDATLFYVNPNEPQGTNGPARAYGTIWTGASEQPQITIEVANRTSAGSLVPSTRANLDLRLSGDVCAAN